ncbi:hypothetical protein SO694_00002161 [Aureococcus anophagefferens]|uniref:Uncharacterized protein n=1 Tax=Aureococcus anophagefferens TaxID=44056 RepID=A0ABR1GCP1_AURAN
MHDPEKLDQLSPSGCVLPRPAAVVLVKTRRFSALERRSVGAAVTWDALAPGVVICQLAKGHRFSNDDQLTAPPYFDPRDGVPSAHDQKAYCRLEYRGGLDEYCAAAALELAGRGVRVGHGGGDGRNDACPARHGLVVIDRVDVVFKAGRPPHICERMHLPPSTPPGAVRAALERLAAAARESGARAADAATALGMRPTPGSPELRTALAALGAGS